MKRRVLIASVWLVASACTGGTTPNDTITQDATDTSPTGLFMNRYHPTTDIATCSAATTALASIEAAAEADQWDTVEGGIAAGTPANTLLARLDMEFIEGGSSSQYSITSTVRQGITLGRAATTDDQRDVAHETVAKILAVARGLAATSGLRSAASQANAGQVAMSRGAWDCAAVYFAALEPTVREYQVQTVMNVWGPGRNAIASDNIADTVVDMLVRGATAIDAAQARTVIETGNETDLYLSRVYVMMSNKYAASLEDATAAMTEIDPGWHPEGQYSFEGVIDPLVGLMGSGTVAGAARGHWRMTPMIISRAQHLRDLGSLYAAANQPRLDAFTAAMANDRYATVARFRGTVGALKDPLIAAGQDPAMLLVQVDTARTQLEADNAAGALTALQTVQSAVTGLATGGM